MTDSNFYIETPRLYISHYQPSNDAHCDFKVVLYNQPELIKGQHRNASAFPDRTSARAFILETQDEQARSGYGRFLVSLKPSSVNPNKLFSEIQSECEMVGQVSLKFAQGPYAYTAPDVGYGFLSKYWGNGYATEASAALLKYFEEEKGVKEVFGFCNANNEGSMGVLRRLGFQQRGVMDLKPYGVHGMVWVKPGMSEDLSVYGLTG
ncbi:including n-acetylases of ribosomal protein [Clohesyomyces aquaticus]|uniref:Including n-acetylases of ribosomal protein n=1 Tax=Clohesyomyces aquaticus TaxID=1231657 RepID=A0A1Y2A781_9PLEO|nr:including n-acetylases of ribosomal protein [Clohesyomyces aquaticus]